MNDELDRIIKAYQWKYGLTRLQAIKSIKQDLTQIAHSLTPVKI